MQNKMKKWLKYLLVLCVLLFRTGFAMAQYVTIGTGTLTQDRLFYTTFEDVRSLLTFSNNELTNASPSLNQGDTIYSIGWDVQSLGGQAMYNANIKIRETGAPVTVWSGTLAPTTGWNDILLHNPYIRQGSGDLIIEYCFDNCESIQQVFYVRKTNTLTNTNQFFCSDDQLGCSLTSTSSFSGNSSGSFNNTERPNTRFGLSVPGATYINDTICTGQSTTLSSTSSLTLNTNISGFTYEGIHNGSYYFLSTSNKSWLEADLDCQSKGGHLAHIANISENSFVMNSVINTSSWIGYHQNCNSGLFSEPFGGWQWTDGSITNYTNWNNNEPNDYYGFFSENYVEMYTNGKWNDHQKTQINPYVMEIEEFFLWNTGSTLPSISVNPTVNTTYWVHHTLGTETTTEYFNVIIASGDGCTDPNSCNYDPLANCDDGSCTGILGCIDPAACNYNSLANCDDGSCVSGLVTIDTINIQHIACPNGGEVGIASILQSDYTNHSWLNISNGQLYNGGGGNGGLSRNDLAAGLYVITASMPTNPLCNNITYSDTFEILEASPSFNFSSNQACPDTCNLSVNADMQLAISGVSYTMFFNSNFFTFPVTIQNQCGGIHTYTILADGISCNSDVIGVSQFAPMNLQTIVVDQTCNIMGSAEVVITGVSAPGLDTYCSNSPQFNSYSIIEDVVFVGDNTSISNNTQGVCGTYVDYTVQSADVTPGSSYTVDINLGTCSSQGTAWVDFAKVYIDWNIDGDFDDAGEMVAQISPILSPSTHSLIINIPVNAISGQSRMRIVSQNEDYQPLNNANPCDDQVAYFGETEDYTIIVNGSVATPVSYLWSDGQNTAIATNLSSGTYYVAVTDANGCTSSDTAIINGGASNISVTATFDQTICAGYTPSSLNASSGAVAGTYSWADASNPLVILGTGSNFSPPPLTSTTTYTVTLTDNNGCVATDDIVITVSPVPSVSLTAVPNPACEGDDILLTATSSIPVNQYKFQVNNGSWSDLTSPGWGNSSSFTYNNITTTTQFRVQVKENNGCNASGWSTITVQINNITTPLISHN